MSEPRDEMHDPDVVHGLLERWAGERVAWLRPLPGHSGVTWGFGTDAESLVIKLAPRRARLNADTDIAAQARILEAMAAHGMRVPAVRDAGAADDGPFGVPFVVTTFVAGATPGDAFDTADPPTGDLTGLFAQGVAELRRLHAIPWTGELEAIFRRRGPADEVVHWDPVLAKAQDPRWIEAGTALRDRLLADVPAEARGVCHGDFYANNWLFADGTLAAVLDWENAVGGAVLTDLGWLCMIYDPASWGPSRQPLLAACPTPEALIEQYAGPDDPDLRRLGWFRAAAGYKLAALTAHFLRLHRTGRRPDPVWEVFGEAFWPMIDRAHALLDRCAARM